MAKRRISPDELAIGTVLAWDVSDEHGRLLLKKGQTISRASQVSGLIERGMFIEDDTAAERPPLLLRPQTPALKSSAVALVFEARQRLELACSSQGSKARFVEHIFAIRELIRQACEINFDAALAMTLLARTGRYSIRHSVDSAIACHVAGEALEICEPELSSAVAGALTMNISMLQLQDRLQAQEEPLTDEQRDAVRRHPETAVATLREYGVTDELWLQVVLAHHETADGSGYRGMSGDEIPLPAQLVSLADIYCARISSRDYRAPMRPNAALRSLFLQQGNKVREGLASRFIKVIGVFPSGTPVRLDNGEIAVVTGRGKSVKTPDVCAIIGEHGMPLVVPARRDTAQPPFAVREVVSWSELGAPPSMQSIWGKAAAIA